MLHCNSGFERWIRWYLNPSSWVTTVSGNVLPPSQACLRAAQMLRRIKHACVLLREDALPIKKIAERSSFADEFHFSKRFRQIIGQPQGSSATSEAETTIRRQTRSEKLLHTAHGGYPAHPAGVSDEPSHWVLLEDLFCSIPPRSYPGLVWCMLIKRRACRDWCAVAGGHRHISAESCRACRGRHRAGGWSRG